MDNQLQNTRTSNMNFIDYQLAKVEEQAVIMNRNFSESEKAAIEEILIGTYNQVLASKKDINNVAWTRSNFPNQVMRMVRLGLTPSDGDIYPMVRKNEKLGKEMVVLSLQYQGELKLLKKFCTKGNGIRNFLCEIILEGDDFEISRDLDTGETKITKHNFDLLRVIDARSKVKGVYAIAYHEDGTKTFVLLPYERIQRAKSAALTTKIWESDYVKMVKKTAIHELYRNLKPYMKVPDDMKKDFNDTVMGVAENEINRNNQASNVIEVQFEDENQSEINSDEVKVLENNAQVIDVMPEAKKGEEAVLVEINQTDEENDNLLDIDSLTFEDVE